jgi:hypothetical protein
MYVLIRGTAHGKTVVAHGGRCCAVKASRTSGGHHTSTEVVHHTSRGCEVCGVLFFRSLWSSLLLNSVHVLKLQPTETNINQSNSWHGTKTSPCQKMMKPTMFSMVFLLLLLARGTQRCGRVGQAREERTCPHIIGIRPSNWTTV